MGGDKKAKKADKKRRLNFLNDMANKAKEIANKVADKTKEGYNKLSESIKKQGIAAGNAAVKADAKIEEAAKKVSDKIAAKKAEAETKRRILNLSAAPKN